MCMRDVNEDDPFKIFPQAYCGITVRRESVWRSLHRGTQFGLLKVLRSWKPMCVLQLSQLFENLLTGASAGM